MYLVEVTWLTRDLVSLRSLVWGACKHAFHMHCLMKWLESLQSARQHCPMCRQEWKFRHD